VKVDEKDVTGEGESSKIVGLFRGMVWYGMVEYGVVVAVVVR